MEDKIILFKTINSKHNNLSFSQCGEDLIVDFVLKNHLSISIPKYLDIGANDPVKFNNTYYFYLRSSTGVLIEPDPDLVRLIKRSRKKDIILPVGISDNAGKKNLYLMDPHTLNTFSSREAKLYPKFYPGVKPRGVQKTEMVTINQVINKYFPNGVDFLSIDIEGLDKIVIEDLNFDKCRPTVICIESMIYGEKKSLTKSKIIAQFLYKKSYFKYADTFVNTIFVDRLEWEKKGQPVLKNMEGFDV